MFTTHAWTVKTTLGEAFSGDDHARMAALIYRRFGRDTVATRQAWQRLFENNVSIEDIRTLVRNGLALERLAELECNNYAYADRTKEFARIIDNIEVI